MPIAMRPSERSCSVAYALASTVGSRVPGFVTKWPSLIFDVSRAATASSGIDSCQRTCESYVHAYSNPCALGELDQLEPARVRRVGQDGDAEAQAHGSLLVAGARFSLLRQDPAVKVICAGGTDAPHAAELENELPSKPLLFGVETNT